MVKESDLPCKFGNSFVHLNWTQIMPQLLLLLLVQWTYNLFIILFVITTTCEIKRNSYTKTFSKISLKYKITHALQ